MGKAIHAVTNTTPVAVPGRCRQVTSPAVRTRLPLRAAPTSPASRQLLLSCVRALRAISVMLWPVMPVFADDLCAAFGQARPGIWAADYTVHPENGGLSVIAHEFGHDLGLPDEYDTSGPPRYAGLDD